jgi:hypothetical protein
VNSNPPIKGHELLFDGDRLLTINPLTDDYYPEGDALRWRGGCRCGAKPPQWPNLSIYAMRRWHRHHKAVLRRGDSDV